MGAALTRGVTVLGNLAVDRIDGAPPSAGGCPAFVGPVLAQLGEGRIVAQAAPADMPLMEPVLAASGVPFTVLPAQSTSAFGLHYDGDHRRMTVDAIGPAWGAQQIAAAQVSTTWAHLSPLLRSDLTAPTIAALTATGVRVALDGQGLVRLPIVGDLQADGAVDLALLAGVQVLKLADDEAELLAGGRPFGLRAAERLGVPEIVVTAGSRGSTVFVEGEATQVPPPFQVDGVHATGAGDAFTAAYTASRARGEEPIVAAEFAAQLVAEMLQVRRELG